ncbi:MAG: formylglycine-generating enzyme family protein [Nitrospinae bacterium]|nr:formylglycine-generating enzyme family protein [Nitrospinota bacterium]
MTKIEGDFTASIKIIDVVANEVVMSKSDICRKCAIVDVVEKLKSLAGGGEKAEKAPTPTVETPSEEPPSRAEDSKDAEVLYWNSIKDGKNADDFSAYLEDYPKGKFAGLAKRRMASLRKEKADAAINADFSRWDGIKDSSSANDFEGYLKDFPKGKFANLAKSRLTRIRAEQKDAEANAEREKREAEAKAEREQNGMARIPAGEFWMGSSDADLDWVRKTWNLDAKTLKIVTAVEQPRHRVRLKAFSMDKNLVTNGQFGEFVSRTGYRTDAEKGGNGDTADDKGKIQITNGAYWREPNGPGSGYDGENYPVVQVSWNDAKAYCKWKGKRLPTEAEWEYSAKGGHDWRYPWGNDKPGNNQANFADSSSGLLWADDNVSDGYRRLSPVGTYPANGYGLYDMAGNAWEWVADWYDENYYNKSPSDNPKGPSSGSSKVLRGGSWDGGASLLRVAFRINATPVYRSSAGGFRCVQ